MTRINLYDPGMTAKSLDFDTEGEALASFVPGAYKTYTDALISTNGKVTHIAKRVVGDDTWNIKVRPKANRSTEEEPYLGAHAPVEE